MKASGEKFMVELQAMPQWSTPAVKRLRAFLKMAKRSYGLRCTRCRESKSVVINRPQPITNTGGQP